MSDTPAQPEQKLGPVIDGLGITATVAPNTLISAAIVILQTVLPDGQIRLSITSSQGLSWTNRAGMLHLASTLETQRAARAIEPGA